MMVDRQTSEHDARGDNRVQRIDPSELLAECPDPTLITPRDPIRSHGVDAIGRAGISVR
jgi:hypothetical protein